MDGEFPLDPFPLDDAADGKRLAGAAAGPGDHDAGINLHACLFAFENVAVDVNRVANLKMRNLRLQARFLDRVQQ